MEGPEKQVKNKYIAFVAVVSMSQLTFGPFPDHNTPSLKISILNVFVEIISCYHISRSWERTAKQIIGKYAETYGGQF